MIYYMVKEQFDGVRVFNKNRFICSLCGGELLTPGEYRKVINHCTTGFPYPRNKEHVEKRDVFQSIELKKTDTCIIDGYRFSKVVIK